MRLSEQIEAATGRRLPESAKAAFDSTDKHIQGFLRDHVESPSEIARINEQIRKDPSLNWPDHLLVFFNFSDEESQSYWAIDLRDGAIWLYPHEGGPCERDSDNLSDLCRGELDAQREISLFEDSSAKKSSSSHAGTTVAVSAVASIPVIYWLVGAAVSLIAFHQVYWKDHECRAYRDDFVEELSAKGVEVNEARDVWYYSHVTMKFRDVDCSDYAKRQIEKDKQ